MTRKEINHRYYKKNKEKLSIKKKQKYWGDLEASRRYYREYAQAHREQRKKYREEHKEVINRRKREKYYDIRIRQIPKYFILETGELFYTQSELLERFECSYPTIRNAIRTGRKMNGLTICSIKEGERCKN